MTNHSSQTESFKHSSRSAGQHESQSWNYYNVNKTCAILTSKNNSNNRKRRHEYRMERKLWRSHQESLKQCQRMWNKSLVILNQKLKLCKYIHEIFLSHECYNCRLYILIKTQIELEQVTSWTEWIAYENTLIYNLKVDCRCKTSARVTQHPLILTPDKNTYICQNSEKVHTYTLCKMSGNSMWCHTSVKNPYNINVNWRVFKSGVT